MNTPDGSPSLWMPMIGKAVTARIAATCDGPLARIAPAPPSSAARAIRAISSAESNGSPGMDWQDTTRLPGGSNVTIGGG